MIPVSNGNYNFALTGNPVPVEDLRELFAGNLPVFDRSENGYMNEYFDRIAEYLRDRSRLSFSGHKRVTLRKRLESRLEQLQLPDFSSYWELLRANPDEEANLFDLSTTNETSFFRNPAQFASLKERIIPSIICQASAEKSVIRLLSAGCSTGEEPYSIAMTLLDVLGGSENIRVEIVAGDISESCLAVAMEGYYDDAKLVKLPLGYRERFMADAPGGARVNDDVRRIVSFRRLNLSELMSADSPSWVAGIGFFDIIFCRNVMIYFARSCQQQLVDTLHRLTLPGGYLFTGDAEPLHLFSHEFKPVADTGCLIYQKMESKK